MPIGVGLRLPIDVTGSTALTPVELFAANNLGAWYDPSDFLPNWRRNLLTYTEQFDDAYWTKSNSAISANAAAAPDGTVTADLLYPSTSGSDRRVIRTLALTSGSNYAVSVYAKAAGKNFIYLLVPKANTINDVVWFNVANGTVGTVGSAAVSATITPSGNGFFRCTVVGPADGADVFAVNVADADNSTNVTASGTNGVLIWGAQLEVGSTATSYQQIVTPEITYLTYQPNPVMYQDAAGTIPVTAVEQAVGLIADKSNGRSLGAELVANNTFATDTSWTKGTGWSIGSGVATKTAGTASVLSQAEAFMPGATYRLVYTITRTAGSIQPRFTGGTTVNGTSRSAAGTYVEVLTAVSGNITLEFLADAAFAGTVDNVYLKRVAGNDAWQLTSTSRPVLSARVNLLTYSEQFTNAAWIKQSGVTAPDNTTVTVTTANTGIYQSASNPAATYAVQGEFKYVDADSITFGLVNVADTLIYTFSTNALSGPAASNAQVTVLGDGWLRIRYTYAVASAGTFGPIIKPRSIGSVQARNIDFRIANDGVGLPTYQRIAAATDYDTVGFPLYLRFDGTDDSLATSSINFTSTDKMTVWAGTRSLVEAAGTQVIVELSSAFASNAGAFVLAKANTPTTFLFRSRGSAVPANILYAAATPSPVTVILTGTGNIPAPLTTLRNNSAQVDLTDSQGTGTFGNYPLYIGTRGGSSFYYNGRLYNLVVWGAQANAAQISAIETWVNGKTKAY